MREVPGLTWDGWALSRTGEASGFLPGALTESITVKRRRLFAADFRAVESAGMPVIEEGAPQKGLGRSR